LGVATLGLHFARLGRQLPGRVVSADNALRQHRELILNYFRAQKLISSGVVEGLNNKAKVTMGKSYGFRTHRVLELAPYHSLGKLPEPESTHDFF
jgi:transposase